MAATARARGGLSRLLFNINPRNPKTLPLPHFTPRTIAKPQLLPATTAASRSPHLRPFSSAALSAAVAESNRAIQEILEDARREKEREREERRKRGEVVNEREEDEAEEEEDYLGVSELIAKLERRYSKYRQQDLEIYEEPTESEDDEDERWSPQELEKREDEYQRKLKRFDELRSNFKNAKTADEKRKWMARMAKFEEKHLKMPVEYIVIGDLFERLKGANGKEKFILQQKLNRALRMMEVKEAYDPNDPNNFGAFKLKQGHESSDEQDSSDEEDNEEFNDLKEKDRILLQKIDDLEKKLEEKISLLDHTFGKKGKVLEEEIKVLTEERNALIEEKRRPLYRKGFEVKPIDINRTCKVTKGGRIFKYTALLACGNLNGVAGFAKAKGQNVRDAIQKAHIKCFQNLHYIERHEEHTISHAVQAKYEQTKVYLWPGRTRTGMKAGKTVETVLHLAGFKNVKSKVIGSRNPHNTVKALFKALNAIETPKDVQQKFGRTVVESHLL
ncbi:hypothetical protein QJS04_geneDACA000164 [Acorus gramineus]|uniref:S5 DRBM domain-containing protein n=1 Tax=Acorus gramineus TaxID=55184 RepID=A0AAV9AR56_ACOGR|nr:hypothetical protein QJS04_geneDACA000164 [Acorus gramineus]